MPFRKTCYANTLLHFNAYLYCLRFALKAMQNFFYLWMIKAIYFCVMSIQFEAITPLLILWNMFSDLVLLPLLLILLVTLRNSSAKPDGAPCNALYGFTPPHGPENDTYLEGFRVRFQNLFNEETKCDDGKSLVKCT